MIVNTQIGHKTFMGAASRRLAGSSPHFGTRSNDSPTMLVLAPLIGLMAQATLAAVAGYSSGPHQTEEFREILQICRTEFVWALVALAGVVVLGTLKGIIVSLIVLAYRVADPPVYVLARMPGTNVFRPGSKEHPDHETFPAY